MFPAFMFAAGPILCLLFNVGFILIGRLKVSTSKAVLSSVT